MQDKSKTSDDVLCCPLCGSEEYLLSDSNTMLCGGCGSMIENVDQFHIDTPVINHLDLFCGPLHRTALVH